MESCCECQLGDLSSREKGVGRWPKIINCLSWNLMLEPRDSRAEVLNGFCCLGSIYVCMYVCVIFKVKMCHCYPMYVLFILLN